MLIGNVRVASRLYLRILQITIHISIHLSLITFLALSRADQVAHINVRVRQKLGRRLLADAFRAGGTLFFKESEVKLITLLGSCRRRTLS